MNQHQQKLGLLAFLVMALAAAHPAMAQTATDYTSITSAVNWTAVGVGILAIGALMAAPLVVRKGAKLVLSMIR